MIPAAPEQECGERPTPVVFGASSLAFERVLDVLQETLPDFEIGAPQDLIAAVEDGRTAVQILANADDIARLRELLEQAPRLRIGSLVLLATDATTRTACEAQPWPITWDIVSHPAPQALWEQVLGRMRRQARWRNAGAISVARAEPTPDWINPFTVAYTFDHPIAARGQVASAVDSALGAILARFDPMSATRIAMAVARAHRQGDWATEWLIPAGSDGGTPHPQLVLVRVLDGDDGVPRIVGLGLDLDADLASACTDPHLQALLHESAGGGSVASWTWDIAAGTWQVKGAPYLRGADRPALPRDAFELVHEADRDAVRRCLRDCLGQGRRFVIEARVVLPGGDTRWFTIAGTPHSDRGGVRSRITGVGIDISARKRAELALAESQRQLEESLRSSRMCLWSLDVAADALFLEGSSEELLGATPQNLRGLVECVAPADRERLARAMARRLESDEALDLVVVREHEGRDRWLAISAGDAIECVGGRRIVRGRIIDVTRRHRDELDARRVEHLLDVALEAAGLNSWSVDLATGRRTPGPRDIEFYGRPLYSLDEFLEHVPAGERSLVDPLLDRNAAANGGIMMTEFRIRHLDGSTRWLCTRARATTNRDGAAEILYGVTFDNTARRRAELDLQLSRRQLSDALEAGGMVLWRWTSEHGFTIEYGDTRNLLGGRAPSGMEVRAHLHRGDRHRVVAAFAHSLRFGLPYADEFRVDAGEGGAHVVQVQGLPYARGDAEGARGIWGVLIDVTEHRRVERELQLASGRLYQALTAAGMIVFELPVAALRADREGAMQRAFGSIGAGDRAAFDDALEATIESRGALQHTYRAVSDGSIVQWRQAFGRFELGDGGARVSGVLMDVSRHKLAEAKLREALQVAYTASEAKSSFLASMSHEIRTPLNAVIGYTGLLADSRLDHDQAAHVRTLRGSAQQLLSLINDILDFSRIEAGELPIEAHPFDLAEAIDACLDLVAPQAEARAIVLAAVVRAPSRRTVVGDVTRVRQIVVNLLDNAIKFTADGGVVCRLDVADDGLVARVRVAVEDTGIGLTPDVRARLFQPFQQGDASTTRRFGGTGLGLSISHRLVAMLGGRIRADADVERGSRFVVEFELPWAEASQQATMPRASPEKEARLRIEDAVLRGAVREQLEAWGVAVVETGVSAVASDAWLELGGERDGDAPRRVSLARVLRPGDLQRALQGSAPLPVQAVSTAASGVAAVARLPSPPLRVLIAEDNAVNQKLLQLQIESLGHRAQVVGSGDEALAAIAIDHFDVVLMDVEMPGMDGIETARRIRADARSRNAYIAAVTAHATSEMRNRLLAGEMDDFIAKPVVRDELLRVLDRAATCRMPARD